MRQQQQPHQEQQQQQQQQRRPLLADMSGMLGQSNLHFTQQQLAEKPELLEENKGALQHRWIKAMQSSLYSFHPGANSFRWQDIKAAAEPFMLAGDQLPAAMITRMEADWDARREQVFQGWAHWTNPGPQATQDSTRLQDLLKQLAGALFQLAQQHVRGPTAEVDPDSVQPLGRGEEVQSLKGRVHACHGYLIAQGACQPDAPLHKFLSLLRGVPGHPYSHVLAEVIQTIKVEVLRLRPTAANWEQALQQAADRAAEAYSNLLRYHRSERSSEPVAMHQGPSRNHSPARSERHSSPARQQPQQPFPQPPWSPGGFAAASAPPMHVQVPGYMMPYGYPPPYGSPYGPPPYGPAPMGPMHGMPYYPAQPYGNYGYGAEGGHSLATGGSWKGKGKEKTSTMLDPNQMRLLTKEEAREYYATEQYKATRAHCQRMGWDPTLLPYPQAVAVGPGQSAVACQFCERRLHMPTECWVADPNICRVPQVRAQFQHLHEALGRKLRAAGAAHVTVGYGHGSSGVPAGVHVLGSSSSGSGNFMHDPFVAAGPFSRPYGSGQACVCFAEPVVTAVHEYSGSTKAAAPDQPTMAEQGVAASTPARLASFVPQQQDINTTLRAKALAPPAVPAAKEEPGVSINISVNIAKGCEQGWLQSVADALQAAVKGSSASGKQPETQAASNSSAGDYLRQPGQDTAGRRAALRHMRQGIVLSRMPAQLDGRPGYGGAARPRLYYADNSREELGIGVIGSKGLEYSNSTLVDNASSLTLISAAFAEQTGLPVQESLMNLTNSTGSALQLSKSVSLQLQLPMGYTIPIVANVVPNSGSAPLPYSLLLGNDVLDEYGVQLDTINMRLVIDRYYLDEAVSYPGHQYLYVPLLQPQMLVGSASAATTANTAHAASETEGVCLVIVAEEAMAACPGGGRVVTGSGPMVPNSGAAQGLGAAALSRGSAGPPLSRASDLCALCEPTAGSGQRGSSSGTQEGVVGESAPEAAGQPVRGFVSSALAMASHPLQQLLPTATDRFKAAASWWPKARDLPFNTVEYGGSRSNRKAAGGMIALFMLLLLPVLPFYLPPAQPKPPAMEPMYQYAAMPSVRPTATALTSTVAPDADPPDPPMSPANTQPAEPTNATQLFNLLPEADIPLPAGMKGWRHPLGPIICKRDDVTPEQYARLDAILQRNKAVFANSLSDLREGYRGPEGPLHIKMMHDQPIITPPRRLSQAEAAVQDKHCMELYEAGLIEPAPLNCKYASMPVIAGKKGPDGNMTDTRFCINYIKVNEAMEPCRHQLPDLPAMHRKLASKRFLTTTDMRQSFMQRPVADDSRCITAFWWIGADGKGGPGGNKLWQFTRVPFGLKVASQEHQRIMDSLLARNNLTDTIPIWVDDGCVGTDTCDENLDATDLFFQAMAKDGMKVHARKTILLAPAQDYCGWQVGLGLMSAQQAHIKALRDLPPPRNVSELRGVLGKLRYYAPLEPNFSAIAQPLNKLLKKDAVWQWTEECAAAFDQLKASICAEGKALRPPDNSKPFFLYTDFSNKGLGAVLGQKTEGTNGQDYIVACASRSTNKHEANYSSFKGEMLAVVWACKTFRPLIYGCELTIVTDHSPLQWLMRNTGLTGQYARWQCMLQEFMPFSIVHRAGELHSNADVLSRWPMPQTADTTGTQLDGVRTDSVELMPPLTAVAAVLSHLPQTAEASAESSSLVCALDAYSPGDAVPWDADLDGWDTPVTCLSSGIVLGGEESERLHTAWQHNATALHACSPAQLDDSLPIFWTHSAVAAASVIERDAVQAEAADNTEGQYTHGDVWQDAACMHYLRTLSQFGVGSLPAGCSDIERRRIQRRADKYTMHGAQLLRRMVDHTTRIVPAPVGRLQAVKQVHNESGHFGRKRTLALLRNTFWWCGMSQDVDQVCSACVICSRVAAGFNAQHPTLHSLPVMGLGYRWHFDLSGPYPVSGLGNSYIFHAVEAFSKWIELVPLPSKSTKHTTAALAAHLGRYGACAEAVTDQGKEWEGSFDQLLSKALIDHRVTSPGHPQANGAVERSVAVVKKALTKMILGSELPEAQRKDWDSLLAWVALAYNCSPQASTGFSPAQIMFARNPILPPAKVERLSHPFSLDDPEVAAISLANRAAFVAEVTPIVWGNLLVAQHRDTERYALTRSGAWRPQLRRFYEGQFVWVKRLQDTPNLHPASYPQVLQIIQIHGNGVVTLQGKCGTRITERVEHLAPCNLPVPDPVVDARLAYPLDTLPCSVCRSSGDAHVFLLCDGCGAGYHTYCLPEPLDSVPEGDWYCPECHAAGRVPDVPRPAPRRSQPSKEMVPSAASKRRDATAQELDARVLFVPAAGVGRHALWGVLKFHGAHHRPYYWEGRMINGQVHRHLTLSSFRGKGSWLWPADKEVPPEINLQLMQIWAEPEWPRADMQPALHEPVAFGAPALISAAAVAAPAWSLAHKI